MLKLIIEEGENIKKYKDAKLLMEIFCIVYFILAIIIGSTISTRFNTPIPAMEFMQSFVIPWIIMPIIIIFVLAHYDNILSGVLLLIYEIFIAVEYFNANDYTNKLNHLTSERFYMFVAIPVVVGILYLYTYIKHKNNNIKNSRNK